MQDFFRSVVHWSLVHWANRLIVQLQDCLIVNCKLPTVNRQLLFNQVIQFIQFWRKHNLNSSVFASAISICIST